MEAGPLGAWAGPDDQPGPDTSLDELNALVPATEELDLLDQHREQVARAEREEAYRRDAPRLDPEATTPASAAGQRADPASDAEAVPSPSLTLGQAIGFLHDVLGAEVVSDDPESTGPLS